MVPGLQVAQIDSNKWAISARGFNDRFSSHLLVMIDGRSLYTPIYSGVFWHREDTPLEDVERIEVVRGAGAAMWGANAVNGVINIITKSAKDTQGTLLTAGGGNQEQGFGSARYGDKIGDDFYYRVYGKAFRRNNNLTSVGQQNAQDDWENYQGGFKTEWQASERDTVTTQGDIFHSHTGDKETYALFAPPFEIDNKDTPGNYSGGNLQTRWTHKLSEDSETVLQAYYQHNDNNWQLITPFNWHERTFNIDFQNRFVFQEQHDVIWGAGYRYFDFSSNQSAKLSFNPSERALQLFSGFIQDEISFLNNDEVKLTIGSRLEHNDFTGFEVQPNIRLLWAPDDKQSLWGAISRAVRTPNLANHNLSNFSGTSAQAIPAYILVNGNPQVKSEIVLDYELGYRLQATPTLSFDVATFYNQYSRLQALQILNPNIIANPLHMEVPIEFTNKMHGDSLGAEFTTQWQATNWLKMQLSYWFVKANLHTPAGLQFSDGERIEKDTPQQQFHFKTSLNLPYQIEFDTQVRYVDDLPAYPVADYVAVDMRLAWHPLKNLELSVVGQNLLDKGHAEFRGTIFELPRTEIQRSIFGKVALSF
jgi:iron complex outermembrane receptor protein